MSSINQIVPPLLPVSLIKTEASTIIKNECPESDIVEIVVDDILGSSESEEEIFPDTKDIDILLHPLCENLIKNEAVSTDILETKYYEDFMKTENAPFAKIEKIIDSKILYMTKDTSYGNGQEVMEVQDSNKYFNDLSNLETTSRKAKYPEKTDLTECHQTVDGIQKKWKKEKIKVIRAPDIPVEPHEYTSLAKDKHVCNHCQRTCKALRGIKRHIKKLHRKVTTMYKCPYCRYKSKYSLRYHIIHKHKEAKDILWFGCHLCDAKFKIKSRLTRHMKVHLTSNEMQNWSELCLVCGKRKTYKKFEKRYCSEKCALLSGKSYKTKAEIVDKQYQCDKCSYKTGHPQNFKKHKVTHLKPEEIEYFYCYHCSYKCKLKGSLRIHILRHYRNKDVPFHCYICDFMTPDRELIIEHLKKHPKHRSKLCEAKLKYQLETSKKLETRYRCDQCEYKTYGLTYMNNHSLTHLNPKEIEYFYCHHCLHKSKFKWDLRSHIFRHFRNEEVPFHCYICDFTTPNRDLIIGHIRKHFKNTNKYDETIRKYELETNTEKLKKRYSCDKCFYQTFSRHSLEAHKIVHLKPEEVEYFHCYHCPFKSKYKPNLRLHISMHFRNEQIPFHCHICDFTTSKRDVIIDHFKTHSKHHSKCDETKNEDLKTRIEELRKGYSCDKCNYKTDVRRNLTRHEKNHLKPEDTQYFYCYHCSFKSKFKGNLRPHLLSHFRNEDVPFYCYVCDFKTLKRAVIIKHLKKHSKYPSKSNATKYKDQLETSKQHANRYCCDQCDYKTNIHRNLKRHKLIHLKPEEIEYFYCHHCSYRSKQKQILKNHILRHFKNANVLFHCHICDFKTLKRDAIVKHFKKHSKR